ncbi:restriction endonuclease subunit S [Vibrio lentus]|uniref:Type I restriction endonuclease subunit S n=1 Tax=Vibrio lentus TaxID=136468 RepID=A0A4U2ERH0_9VIBR|nr:restriction endonuclease subunit S [Vibrio lentus]PML09886.1 type I restriction endonuclease subunit S [Vibrio lentus]TKG06195.1 type I restriction endonuclease subunit S [Vibrio lentus]
MLDMEAINNFSIDKSDWKKVKFGEVVFEPKESVKDPIAEGIEHVVGLEHIDSEDMHLRRSATIEKSTTFTKKFCIGDVLFGRRRAYLKKAAQANFKGICSGDITVMRAKEDILEPDLLPFIVNNDKFFDHAITHSAGGLSPRVKFKDLADYEFYLPTKDKQFELIELLNGALSALNAKNISSRKVESLLKSFQNQYLDKGYYSNRSLLPDDWVMKKIKDFAKVQAGATPLRSNKDYFDNGTTYWVKTLDLNNGEINFSEEKISDKAIQKTSCKVKPINTVLVAMYGGFNQIGRTGILKVEAATNQAISAIEVDESIVLPEYLLHVLNAKLEYWKKVAISSRKDPNITKDDVENFPVPIPPLSTQVHLIKQVNEILNLQKSLNIEKDNFNSFSRVLGAEVF